MVEQAAIRLGCRILHFLSLFGTAAYISTELVAPAESPLVKKIGHVSGIGILVSGIINWWFLRNFKGQGTEQTKQNFKLWTALVHSKLLFTVLVFTPIAKMFMDDSLTLKIRLAASLFFIVGSSVARYLREATQSPSSVAGQHSHKAK